MVGGRVRAGMKDVVSSAIWGQAGPNQGVWGEPGQARSESLAVAMVQKVAYGAISSVWSTRFGNQLEDWRNQITLVCTKDKDSWARCSRWRDGMSKG